MDDDEEDEESGTEEDAEENFHVGDKRGRVNDEDDGEDEKDDGPVKRHRASGTAERFSQNREGEEYQSHAEAEQEYRYGNAEGYGQEVPRHATDRYDAADVHKDKSVDNSQGDIAYQVVDDNEDWESPADLSDEEYDEEDDEEEVDPYSTQKDFESQERDGLPCLPRLFHALDRLSSRGPSPPEITRPRRVLVHRHETFHFNSVADNPFWCDSPEGRAWLNTQWPTFRYEHGWALIDNCHEIVDEYVEYQTQQQANQESRADEQRNP
ncbi:hypothetical protein A1O7_03251 [Cladophialophora yegresii CBS 114405]|uniref:Uncharacterized protein n=1 Tax=Cladophialophora yegresii CBS 114405 TaxID=1182544 RepID=W9WE23_9EURO|nr:uncharacterized protein A1O7_03251 [Cladophialophora yegresii CBS 114405]EXJ62811.1 hypothetical protein A1O7_03251 [Cladophialophora yegresii CBS 114405]